MRHIARVLHTAKTHTIGGREFGASRSSDGLLDVRLSTPGSARMGTNPEQLFAAGWSACFESAIAIAAHKRSIALLAEVSIDAEVDLNLGDAGYFLSARLNVRLPGVARDVAKAEREVSDAMADEVTLCGPADACRERLAAYVRAGATMIIAFPNPVGEPRAAASLRAIEGLGPR